MTDHPPDVRPIEPHHFQPIEGDILCRFCNKVATLMRRRKETGMWQAVCPDHINEEKDS